MFRHVFVAVLLIFGAALPVSAREDARTIVANVDGRYDKVFDALDASGLTGFYSSDATILPPTAAVISGSD
jgi:ketosteroid isomerase-like protein